MISDRTIRAGTILALKTKKTIAYKYLSDNFGKVYADLLEKLLDVKYMHVELYLGEGWVLSAQLNGIKLQKYSLEYISKNFDLFEPNFKFKKDIFIDYASSNFNKPYDWVSLFLNTVNTISETFGIKFEFPYNTKYALICSELIARFYEEQGYEFKKTSEFMTPQDLINSEYFVKL